MNDDCGWVELEPLGVFAIMGLADSRERGAAVLRPLVGHLDREEAALVASYLRGGAVVKPIMEWTSDVLGDRFSTAGGSGILTDGRFFWRGDTADYVEHYRVGLPTVFLERVYALDFVCPDLTDRDVEVAEEQLNDFYRASFDDALWPDSGWFTVSE